MTGNCRCRSRGWIRPYGAPEPEADAFLRLAVRVIQQPLQLTVKHRNLIQKPLSEIRVQTLAGYEILL